MTRSAACSSSSGVRALLCASALGLVAGCGGGGGSGSGQGGSATGPTVKVAFPPTLSLTDQAQVGVAGQATDPDGVAGVSVNGVAAVSGNAYASWQALVGAPQGDSPLSASAVDTLGHATPNVAGPVVRNLGPLLVRPHQMSFDAATHTIYLVDHEAEAVVAIDVDTGAATFKSPQGLTGFRQPQGMAIQAGEAYSLGVNGYVGLFDFHLANGTAELVSGSDGQQTLGSGPAIQSGASVAVSGGTAYVVDGGNDTLVAVTLATGNRTVVSGGGVGSGIALALPGQIALDAVHGYAFVTDFNPAACVIRVDLANGNRSLMTGNGVGQGPALSNTGPLQYDPAADLLWMLDASLERILKIDPATGNRAPVVDLSTPGLPVAAPYGMVLDLPNNRGWVSDYTYRRVLAVNLATQARSVLYDVTRGTGPILRATAGLALDGPGGAAYTVETYTAALARFDLVSGDRTVSSGSGPDLYGVTDVALDAAGGRALALSGKPIPTAGLIAVDLVTGARTQVTGAGVGSGPDLSDPLEVALDLPHQKAYVAQVGTPALMRVDLATGARSVVSGAGVGGGPALLGPTSVALDLVQGFAYLQDGGLNGVVLRVSLVDGTRTLVSGPGVGTGIPFGSTKGLVLDAPGGRLLAHTGDGVVAVSLATGNRSLIVANGLGVGPHVGSFPGDLAFDAASGVLWYLDGISRSLCAANPLTGDRVVVSR